MHMAQQVFHLAELHIRRLEDLWRAGEVIHDGDREDLQRHHLFDVFLSTFVFVRLLKLRNGIVVLVSEFPPVTT